MNLVERARSRIYFQYRNAPKLAAWVSILPKLGQSGIEDELQKVIDILDIDNAAGWQLDVVGAIVGIDRPNVPQSALDGGDDDTSVTVPDDIYRLFIYSKIFKNNSSATIDDVTSASNTLFDQNTKIIDGQDMTFTVLLTKQPDQAVLRVILNYDLLPRPQGVLLAGIIMQSNVFAYRGTPGAQNYDVAPYTEVFYGSH